MSVFNVYNDDDGCGYELIGTCGAERALIQLSVVRAGSVTADAINSEQL